MIVGLFCVKKPIKIVKLNCKMSNFVVKYLYGYYSEIIGGRGMSTIFNSERNRNNFFATIGHGVSSVVMCIICIIQAINLQRAPWHIALALVLGFAPVIGEIICYAKNPKTTMVKHFVGYGFALFYTFFIFTGTNNMFFMFVVPMILVISVYNDIKYSIKINVGVILESVIVVILGATKGGFGYRDKYSAIIQIVLAVMVAVYSTITSVVLNATSNQKLKNVTEAKDRTQSLLDNVSRISEETKAGIDEMSVMLEELNASSIHNKENMEQVSIGINDTADAVQNQLCQTEEIQTKVDTVDEVSSIIAENMDNTLKVLENGKKDVEILVGQVEESVKNGTEVASKLSALDEYIKEMNSIVELISGITSQTSLLSLNASIEAARAGEAGRGFSVVATEISSMATQTQNATDHITKLINNVAAAINEVVSVIYRMIDGINAEKQSTVNTAESFKSIHDNTIAVQENVKKLAIDVKELKEANLVIVDSIQRISGVSEEVSANASETMNSEENNVEILSKISKRMQEVLELTSGE